MPQREPKAHYCEDHGVIVHSTHDVELAAWLAYGWHVENQWSFRGEVIEDLPQPFTDKPVRTWLRTRPARRDEQEEYGFSFWYSRATPNAKGAFRAVEFPEPYTYGPIGTPASLRAVA